MTDQPTPRSQARRLEHQKAELDINKMAELLGQFPGFFSSLDHDEWLAKEEFMAGLELLAPEWWARTAALWASKQAMDAGGEGLLSVGNALIEQKARIDDLEAEREGIIEDRNRFIAHSQKKHLENRKLKAENERLREDVTKLMIFDAGKQRVMTAAKRLRYQDRGPTDSKVVAVIRALEELEAHNGLEEPTPNK